MQRKRKRRTGTGTGVGDENYAEKYLTRAIVGKSKKHAENKEEDEEDGNEVTGRKVPNSCNADCSSDNFSYSYAKNRITQKWIRANGMRNACSGAIFPQTPWPYAKIYKMLSSFVFCFSGFTTHTHTRTRIHIHVHTQTHTFEVLCKYYTFTILFSAMANQVYISR